MIYIETLTTKLRTCNIEDIDRDYVLYSPHKNLNKVIMGKKITIWDNYTFYLYKRLNYQNKQSIAKDHYLWLIDFINNNWQEGITLITPDVDWLDDRLEIETLWRDNCSKYPQLYVPNTWVSSIDDLNIVGYALRRDSKEIHNKWTHCLGHIRDNIESELLTYDASIKLDKAI